jgi:hypothetical protein
MRIKLRLAASHAGARFRRAARHSSRAGVYSRRAGACSRRAARHFPSTFDGDSQGTALGLLQARKLGLQPLYLFSQLLDPHVGDGAHCCPSRGEHFVAAPRLPGQPRTDQSLLFLGKNRNWAGRDRTRRSRRSMVGSRGRQRSAIRRPRCAACRSVCQPAAVPTLARGRQGLHRQLLTLFTNTALHAPGSGIQHPLQIAVSCSFPSRPSSCMGRDSERLLSRLVNANR